MARPNVNDWLSGDNKLLLSDWARNGLPVADMCRRMAITESSFYRWRRENEEFAKIVDNSREKVNVEVEQGLIKVALGYYYEETETITDYNGRTATKTSRKYAKPDTTALIFFLKNRRPEQWRNIYNLQVAGNKELLEQAQKVADYLKEDAKNPIPLFAPEGAKNTLRVNVSDLELPTLEAPAKKRKKKPVDPEEAQDDDDDSAQS